jgi:GT2 family glycosyltransferase
MARKLKIAVITPTIDRAEFLAEAVASVPCAEGVEVEHVVVHDGSDAFARTVEERFPHVRIMRGENRGPGAAVTLGFRSAQADFYIELNSDDLLAGGCFTRLAECVATRPDILIWTGGARFFRTDGDGRKVELRRVASASETALELANVLDDLPLVHARFFHRSVFEQIGYFSPQFEECSDREFMIRAAMAGVTEAPLEHIVSEFRVHEGSQTTSQIRGRVPAYMAAHVRLADHWLSRPDLPPEHRASFANWRAREFVRFAFYQLKAGALAEAATMLGRETLRHPSWPFRALTIVAALKRRSRTS